ncbi:MAG: hypothetical protein QOH60_3207 [Mycobacterium sp.]|jgi:hypothetical protein|nr:hypothetical protein [Mycobacterium sp.]
MSDGPVKVDPTRYIEQFSATLKRMIAQSGEVAKQAAPAISEGKYTAEAWIKSATQLMDITVIGVLEITENLLAGPAAPAAPTFAVSEAFRVLNGEGKDRRVDIQLSRPGTHNYIAQSRITVVSPEGAEPTSVAQNTLPASATHLTFKVDSSNLPGGVYTGQAVVSLLTGGVVGDPVDVFIAL